MTERTSLTDADLDRIEAEANAATPGPWGVMPDYEDHVFYVEADIDGGMFVCGLDANRPDDAGFIATARTDVPALIAEVRRLRAAQTTTLIACSRCGHGHRARHMVALGDERLCVECAGVAMRKLAQAVIVAYDDLEQRNETDAVHALDDVYDIALHAADAPGDG